MRWLAAIFSFVLSFSMWLAPTPQVRAQEAAELLPASTAIYVEIAAPKETLAAVLDHPIRKQLDELPEYKQLFESNEFKQFRLGVGWVELAMTTPWRTAVESLTEGGVYFAADPALGGAAMLVRAKDEATLKRFFDLGVKLVKDDARKKGQDERVKSGEYRGITAHRIDKLRMAAVGRWLVLSDNDEVGKTLLDALLDGNKENLASDAKFKAALAARGGKPAAWAYVRLDDLRDRGFAGGLKKGKADNPAAELIAGGLLSVLQHTPVVTARIDVDATDARLAVQMPIDKQWLPASRSYYFGPDAKGVAPRPLAPPGTLLNLTAYRDLGGFWNAAPDLFDEATNSQLVQANSNLSTLFSGQDFGQDVLTTVKPEWQLVVTRQEFRDGPDSPQIKLPAGALVFQLREPEKMRRSWKITFQSLIGFLNIVGAMERRPPLEIDSTTRGAAQMVTTSYAPPSDEGVLRPGAIYYNFSPTMATVGDRLILSSTRTLAEQLLDAKPADAAAGTSGAAGANGAAGASGAKGDANGAAAVNGRLSFDFKSIHAALNDNRQQLVSQNMLDKGHGREQAEREIGLLLNALGLIRSAALQIDSNESRVQAELSLGLARPGE